MDAHTASHDLADENTVLFGTGKQGNAADFERDANERLRLANHADFRMADSTFSINFWIKPESHTGNTMFMIAKDGESGNREYFVHGQYSSQKRFFFSVFKAGNSENGVKTTADGVLGTWYMVYASYDHVANVQYIEQNRTASASKTTTTLQSSGASSFHIGSRSNNSLYTDGLIDLVGIWRRTLTTAERDTLYNGGAGQSYAQMTGAGGGTRRNAFIFSLAGVVIPAATIAGLYQEGAVAL